MQKLLEDLLPFFGPSADMEEHINKLYKDETGLEPPTMRATDTAHDMINSPDWAIYDEFIDQMHERIYAEIQGGIMDCKDAV